MPNPDKEQRESFLLRATLAGKYRGWEEKNKDKETEHQLESFALIHFGKKKNEIVKEQLNWCPDNNIMNNPYIKRDGSHVEVVGDVAKYTPSDYYPSADDEVYKVRFNANFGYGPSFNGKNFIFPSEPYSTNGNPDIVKCGKEGFCTHIHDIPLGSIVEMTITCYSHRPLYNAYHPIHIHGHEMYVIGSGEATLDPNSPNNIFPNGSHPAFKCSEGE